MVGPEEIKFIPHKAPLCETSIFFQATFNGVFREAQAQKVMLPEDKPDVVEEYLQWTYTRKYAGVDEDKLDKQDEAWMEIETAETLYLFADMADCQELKRQIIFYLFELEKGSRGRYTIHSIARLQELYSKTTAGSAWRKFAVAQRSGFLPSQKDHQLGEIRTMSSECPELAADLLFEHIRKEQRKQKHPFRYGRAEDFFEPAMLQEQ